jgi:hypothetical protein
MRKRGNNKMFKKAKQVIVKEILEDSEPYIYGAIQIGNTLVAMDNGAILDANADWIEILEELSWTNLSEEIVTI